MSTNTRGAGRSRAVVYLDYAATTPLDPAVAQAMCECLSGGDAFGNASSEHVFGWRARAKIEAARSQVAALIGAEPREVFFTSGATESDNLAVLGLARANADRGRHIVTSRIEHKAVLDACRRLEKEGFRIDYLEPDTAGRIDAAAVEAALREDTLLVSIMHVNNEVGVVQDLAAIGALCRAHGVAFHTDAAQSVGKVPLDVRSLPVDFVSFTAHKFYGPKGIGALYVRRAARSLLQPMLFGGGQEGGLRPGTLPTHQIIGFGVACERAARLGGAERQRLAALRERLWSGIEGLGGVHLNGAGAPCAPGILNVSFEGVEGESLVRALRGLALSTGSACSSASREPSYVLRALGRSTRLAESSLRLSLGRFTTDEDVEYAIAAVCRAVGRLRAVSPRSEETAPVVAEGAGADEPVEWDPLSPLARRHFEGLPGAGIIPEKTGHVLRGEAGSESQEAWVRFYVLVGDDTVKDARFQAWGCPHTLAVTSWLATQLPGRQLTGALPGTPEEWAKTLAVPIEKLGRLLIVEDALNACLQR